MASWSYASPGHARMLAHTYAHTDGQTGWKHNATAHTVGRWRHKNTHTVLTDISNTLHSHTPSLKLFRVRNAIVKPEVSTEEAGSTDIWCGLYWWIVACGFLSTALRWSLHSCWYWCEDYTSLWTNITAWQLLTTNCRRQQTAVSTAGEFWQQPTQNTKSANNISGSDRANSLVCVCVSMCDWSITSKWNDFWYRHLACWFVVWHVVSSDGSHVCHSRLNLAVVAVLRWTIYKT